MFLAHRGFPVIRRNGFRNDLDRLFNAFDPDFGQLWPVSERLFPAMNIRDAGAALHVEAELPGFKLDELELTVLGDQLTIKGTRENETNDETTYHRSERWTGTFERTLTLPTDIDAEQVTATLKDGILSITLPKAQASLPRKITVKGTE